MRYETKYPKADMRFKVFISSVQREFAAERQMLAEYVRKDALLGKFFDVFLFEEEPACDAKALDWAGYVERSGHGTEFIIEKCEAQGLATPQYKPDTAIFHTIIWRKTAEAEVDEARPTSPMGGVGAQLGTSQGQVEGTSQGQVMSLFVRITSILAGQVLSSGDITAALGKEYYSGYLRRIIKMLLADGIIEYAIPEKPRSRLQKYRLTEKGRQMLAQKGVHK